MALKTSHLPCPSVSSAHIRCRALRLARHAETTICVMPRVVAETLRCLESTPPNTAESRSLATVNVKDSCSNLCVITHLLKFFNKLGCSHVCQYEVYQKTKRVKTPARID